MSHLQIIAELETVTEMQARVIKIMATRLAELGDTVTGRDEIAQADKAYRDAIGGDEWPDWAEQGGEDDGEPYHTAEHEEFRRRLEEENKRQDTRIGILEDSVRKIGALATSVEKLAVSMQSMLKEQEKQGKRLEALEGRDGEKWRKVMGYIATAIVGIVLGYLFKRIGM